MFGFEDNDHGGNDADEGSAWRFAQRVEKFKMKGVMLPRTEHYAWWIAHNAIAHPLLAIFPLKPSFRFHDWTSRKLNAQ